VPPTDVVDLLGDLIRFDTTNPPGNESACVAHVQRMLEEAGVETRIVAKDDARPNLIARVRGAGEAPPLLLYGHVDVVTTSGQDWTHPPFGGELVDGWVWGRGALDMKGGVAMIVDAFLRAARGEIRPRGDVILAILSDEENGGDFGARFLAQEHADLFEGVRHALGEFGGASQTIGGRRFYPIQVAEKQICWLRGLVHGPGGHAALGVRGSAMGKTGRILARLDSGRLPVHVTPVARAWIEGMAEGLPSPQSLVLRSLLDPRLAELTLRAPIPQLRILDRALRNTVTATIVHGGAKINVVPSEIELELDGRTLPGFGPDELIAEVQTLVGLDLELEVVRHDAYPAHSDLSQMDALSGVLRELDPDAVPVPMLQVGVTDGRFLAGIGIQTYGFLPLKLPDDFEFTKLIHAADERVPADAIRFGAKAVGMAIERYAA
jgi:acetylornithine deacetylase/succinyl-diaminopimelate desuccinylase-like protein